MKRKLAIIILYNIHKMGWIYDPLGTGNCTDISRNSWGSTEPQIGEKSCKGNITKHKPT